MANKLYEEQSIQDIASAIRQKTGASNTYTVGQMGDAVRAIPTGGSPTGTFDITANGLYDVAPYANANVNVQGGTHGMKEWDITISSDVSSGSVALTDRNTPEIVSHYNDPYAIAMLIAATPSETANSFVSVVASNRIIGGSGAAMTYAQLGTYHGSTYFGLYGVSSMLSAETTRGLWAHASGYISYKAASNSILRAGNYKLIFMW